MITNTKFAAYVAGLVLFCGPIADSALADADLQAGKELAYTCLGCHGIEGYRNAYPSFRVPRLGGQKAAYISIALNGYRDGTRMHPTMVAQASSLTDEQIEDVSAYLASINNETVDNGGGDAPAFEKAASCAACHGANGVSVNALWPTLAGQHEDYLLSTLQQYRDGTRKETVMAAQAALLAEEDLAILAEYFADLNGLETTLPEK